MTMRAWLSRIRLRHVLLTVLVLIVVSAAAGGAAMTWKPEIAPIQSPARDAFLDAEIVRGAELAALGDCVVCHTMRDGEPFAGGRGVKTPFGTVYATNITPDPATGIGRWSAEAFNRAMRHGIDREGHHLYPVLPYPHFVHATDDDLAAMYAFLMTRRPVNQHTPKNALSFPFNQRPLIAGWNLLFLRSWQWQPDPARPPDWNRGAYLVQAIGHCGECHTPHNTLGAERHNENLYGGDAEGWYAPALRAGTVAPRTWNTEELTTYFRTGLEASHGAAAGPMAAVTHQLAAVRDADVRAMAVYIASQMPPPTAADWAPPTLRPVDDPNSAAIFGGACGACHSDDAPMTRAGAPSLALSSAVHAPTSRNVVEIIMHGLPWRDGHAGPYMPAFAGALSSPQIGQIAAYVRARFSDLSAWNDIEASIRDAKGQGDGS